MDWAAASRREREGVADTVSAVRSSMDDGENSPASKGKKPTGHGSTLGWHEEKEDDTKNSPRSM